MNDIDLEECARALEFYEKQLGRKQDDWMPPPEMYGYVLEMLKRAEEYEEISPSLWRLDDRWVPLIMIGTMTWLRKALWWLFEYTSFMRTNAPFLYYFNYEGYEFDPERLIAFNENPDNNALEKFWRNPGLNETEKREVSPFVRRYLEKFEVTPPEDAVITNYIIWASLMWVLEEGREWMDDMEELFRCATVYSEGAFGGWSYVSSWEKQGKLLHPELVVHTERDLGVCANDDCENKQWCVGWYRLEDEYGDLLKYHLCHSCAQSLKDEQGYQPDRHDTRFEKGGLCDRCLNTDCPYADVVEGHDGRLIPRKLIAQGTERTEVFWQLADRYGLPRQLAGQTVEDICSHFLNG